MENKDICVSYFYEFKLRRRAVQTARNLAEVFVEERVNERTVQLWSVVIWCPEDEECQGSFPIVDNGQLRASVEASPPFEPNQKSKKLVKWVRSKSVWRWYISTNIMFLDITHHPVFV
jgi:hypothetical protein